MTTSDHVEDAVAPSRRHWWQRKSRTMDDAEAKKKWKRRQVVLAILAALAGLIALGGGITAFDDRSQAFTATVDSQHCSQGVCGIDVDYTQPNGEQFTDNFDGVDIHRIHVYPDGYRVITLYWYPSGDRVDVTGLFWGDVFGPLVALAVIGLLAFGVRFTGRNIRRQAKNAPPPPPQPPRPPVQLGPWYSPPVAPWYPPPPWPPRPSDVPT